MPGEAWFGPNGGIFQDITNAHTHTLLYVYPTGDSNSTTAKTGDITQPGSVPDW